MKKIIAFPVVVLVSGLGLFAAQAQQGGMGTGHEDSHHQGSGMMNGGMTSGGMMGNGMMGDGMGRMMLAMMDADDDGALSIDEFQAVHARMFKMADADGDGRISADELGALCGGAGGSRSE
ncbi:EF hand domain-containing protein [Breoghania corrubedonensis]|uniref:EF hand domain-containing protein n=1 Tax=Breoghania corrubedonensis TaxID=665038 RepID=A0A2T5UU50_9HYPH|nr:EF-hand domain-containing protein [Breoghania corrubedonensis]PTW55008.1 EF hand domain-containing protein [Breoghania corrubedonensis]